MTDHPMFARVLAWSAATSERRGAAALRDELLTGLSGRVVEIGAGSGVLFAHYPPTVTEVIAVEPERTLRAAAGRAAKRAPVPVRVIDATAERVPLPDASLDGAVCSAVLCSVDDPAVVLTELARVVAPGGELRFLEHVASPRPRAAALQRALDTTGAWRRVMGGCRTARPTAATIAESAFAIERLRQFRLTPTPLDVPVPSKILGRARRR